MARKVTKCNLCKYTAKCTTPSSCPVKTTLADKMNAIDEIIQVISEEELTDEDTGYYVYGILKKYNLLKQEENV